MPARTRRRPLLPRVIVFAIVSAVLIGLSHGLDRWCYAHLVYQPAVEEDWQRLLRIAGYVPAWLLVAVCLIAVDLRPRLPWPLTGPFTRATLLSLAAVAGGGGAELAKLVVRRLRPPEGFDATGRYLFRAWGESPWSTGGLGMPSSHAAVAFAAVAMLSRLHPRCAVPLFLLAAGCALTRLQDRAHFFSDCVAAALLGCAAAELLWAWHLRNLARRGITP
ncbi:MAG: phosphatase PAP2 family protein [Phycisphaerales bacterium]|nr:phosphatase PAP2 family protein [Phycisphaerales bacterium]